MLRAASVRFLRRSVACPLPPATRSLSSPSPSSPSPPPPLPAVTTRTIRHWPRPSTGADRIVVLTAYDYPTGLHAERAGVDVVLVGDSLGMVVMGHSTTQPVTLDDMLHHTRATRRAVSRALLVADMPFGSYEVCAGDAMRTAYRLVKDGGADAVKLEGGSQRRVTAVREIVDGGVAVMAHVGLTPQSVSTAGGFRSVGRNAGAAARVLDEALALEEAGAFAVVMECVPPEVARVVTEKLKVPTVGIGAGRYCTGQVLVYHDMLGLMAHSHHNAVAPKFSKQFAEVGPLVDKAIRDYGDEVRSASFPSDKHSPYRIPPDELSKFEEYAGQVKTKRERQPGGGRSEDDIRLY